jgi:hypothetical protein
MPEVWWSNVHQKVFILSCTGQHMRTMELFSLTGYDAFGRFCYDASFGPVSIHLIGSSFKLVGHLVI